MKLRYYLIILAVIFLAFVAMSGCKKKKSDNGTQLTVYSTTQERTANGALVASALGESSELKQAIDESLTNVFADAAALGYSNKLSHSDYIIYVLDDCIPSPVNHTPSFKLRADEYDGTVFDQDPRPGFGYILASEFVIQDGTPPTPTTEYVVCNDLENIRDSARYGAEHIILYNNNLPEYDRTKFHGNGVNHPIIPYRLTK
jgi:hypothetical protein